MSTTNDNNLNQVKEINILDLIYNFWKHKKIFFYILIPMFIVGFLLENYYPKKNIVQVRLSNPFIFNINMYPYETLYSLHIDLTSIHLEKILTIPKKEKLNFYRYYFRNNLLSASNLISFSKTNDDEYNLHNYIKNKKLKVENAIINNVRDERVFNLTLPDGVNLDKFFYDYLVYVHNLAIDKLKDDVLVFENKNLKLLEKDQIYIDFLINSFDDTKKEITNNDNNNVIKKNILLIKKFHDEKRKKINENINSINNLQKEFIKDIIVDGPIVRQIGSKFLILLKYFIPIILSLIIYLFYILFKLSKNHSEN